MCGCENFPSHLILHCFFSNGYLWFYPPFCGPFITCAALICLLENLTKTWQGDGRTPRTQTTFRTLIRPQKHSSPSHIWSLVSHLLHPLILSALIYLVFCLCFFFVYPQFSLPFPGHNLLTLHIAFGHISLIFRHYPPTYIYAHHMFNYSLLVGSHKLDQRFIAEKHWREGGKWLPSSQRIPGCYHTLNQPQR